MLPSISENWTYLMLKIHLKDISMFLYSLYIECFSYQKLNFIDYIENAENRTLTS